MSDWEILIEFCGVTFEVFIKSKSYVDALLNTKVSYPGCRILSVKSGDGVIISKPGKFADN